MTGIHLVRVPSSNAFHVRHLAYNIIRFTTDMSLSIPTSATFNPRRKLDAELLRSQTDNLDRKGSNRLSITVYFVSRPAGAPLGDDNREKVNAGRNDDDDDGKVAIGGNSIEFHTCNRARERPSGTGRSLGDERRTMSVHLVPPALFSFAVGGRGVNFP